MSDELDEVESIKENLGEPGLPEWWRTEENAKDVTMVTTDKATVRDCAEALESTRAETSEALNALIAVIESLRKEIRQLQNHRHPKDEWYSGKPIL